MFCLLRTNDLQRFDSPDGPRLVSQTETLVVETASAAALPGAFLDDGVHPSLSAQKALTATTLAALATRRLPAP